MAVNTTGAFGAKSSRCLTMNGRAALPNVITKSGGRFSYLARRNIAIRGFVFGIRVSRQVKKVCIDFEWLWRALQQALSSAVRDQCGSGECVIESVQHEHASRLSGARFRAEQKKERQAPPNDARPCHSGKGHHAKNTLVKNSKGTAACRCAIRMVERNLTTLWQRVPRFATGNLSVKSMGSVFA